MINKTDIITAMKVQPTIDPAIEISTRVNFIKRQLVNAGLRHLILGISGGIDSTTCARLGQLAVDELNQESGQHEYQFIAVRLPYETQKDEADAQLALDFIQPSQRLAVNIKSGADGIHGEGEGNIEQRDQHTAQRRTDRAGNVERDRIERDCLRDFLGRNLLAHRSLPGGRIERRARAHRQSEGQQQERGYPPGIGQRRECSRDGQHAHLRGQHDAAAVVVVGDGACEHAEEHDRHRGGGLHQRNELVRGRKLGHQPGRADRLQRRAEVGKQVGDPDRAEDRIAKG